MKTTTAASTVWTNWIWPEDVLAFAAEHGAEQYLEPLREASARLFPTARGARAVLDQDPDRLRPPGSRSRVADHVALEDQARRLAADADAGGPQLSAVVLDDVAFQAVAVGRHPRRLVAGDEVAGRLSAARPARIPRLAANRLDMLNDGRRARHFTFGRRSTRRAKPRSKSSR